MGSVLVAGARTPVGRLLGGLAGLSAVELGGLAIRAALTRAGLDPARVDHVVMGQVLQAGSGQIPARQAAALAGIGMQVPALTINKVCLSGLAAIALADQMIRAGECEVVVAGGMESMSRAPHLLPGSRSGHRYGEVALLDHLADDGLEDAFTDHQSMGALTEQHNRGELFVSRKDSDAFAARSHQRARAATLAGRLAEEIVPVAVPQRRGPGLLLEQDEGVRDGVTAASLAHLPAVFAAEGGTITAGSASPISDGAAAVVVASRAAAERLGLPVLAEIGAQASVAGPDSSLQLQPADAVRRALAKEGIGMADLDLLELNEAFAAVVLASARCLGLDAADVDARVNVNGGAVALGHPIGASGTRLALTLALELRRRGGGTGVAALCGGGGQGEALVLRVPPATGSAVR